MKKKDKDKQVNGDQVKEEQDYAVLWDKYVRLQADFDNYRKRSFKERADFVKFANEGLIVELLSILDNFERGIKSAELKKDYGLLHQGVDMILKQLHSLLETKGLSRIKSLGQKFDPHQHEAVEVVEKDGAEEDVITDELQSGYILGGRVIRPAMVKVVKAKETRDDGRKMMDDGEEKIEEEDKEEVKKENKEEENKEVKKEKNKEEENKEDIENKKKREEAEEDKEEEEKEIEGNIE